MRAVFDTNTVVSALLFRAGRLSWLRVTWRRGDVVPVVDRPAVSELIRVLAYPKFKLDGSEIEILLADFLPFAETVDEAGEPPVRLPDCRDPDDQKFLRLAAASGADALVTGDGDLLDLRDDVPFEILRPAELKERLAER